MCMHVASALSVVLEPLLHAQTHAPIRLACPCPFRYEVLYKQLGLSRVVEMVQLGRLDPTRTITLKVGQVC